MSNISFVIKVAGRNIGIGAVLLALLLAGGCATSTPTLEKALTFKATGVAFLEKAGAPSVMPGPKVDAIMEATGRGLPASNAETEIQKRLSALEAAKYRALAKLLEKIHGFHLTRSAKVQDMAFAGEELGIKISGELEGVTVVKSTYDEKGEIAETTVSVKLDIEGNILPDAGQRISPLSLAERKARAEAAARINAVAALREEIGEVYVEQEITVKDLVLNFQTARLAVEGILEGVEFSAPRWPAREKCMVEAALKVKPKDLQRLRGTVRPDQKGQASVP